MNCVSENILRAYQDGELDAAGRLEVEAHVANCGLCAQRLQEMAATSAVVSGRCRHWMRALRTRALMRRWRWRVSKRSTILRWKSQLRFRGCLTGGGGRRGLLRWQRQLFWGAGVSVGAQHGAALPGDIAHRKSAAGAAGFFRAGWQSPDAGNAEARWFRTRWW